MGRPRKRSRFGTIENRRYDEKGRPDRLRPKYRLEGDTRYEIGPTFHSYAAAQKWLDDEEYLLRAGKWTPWSTRKAALTAEKQRGRTLVLDHVYAWIYRTGADALAETTQGLYSSIYTHRLEPYLQGVILADWTSDRARRWWREMLADHPTTAKRNKQAHDLLHAAAADAVAEGLLPTNPVDVPEGRRKVESAEKEIPTEEQLHIIASSVPKVYRNAVYIAALCGLRLGEWSERRRKDVQTIGAGNQRKVYLLIQRQVQRLNGENIVKLPKGGQDPPCAGASPRSAPARSPAAALRPGRR